MQSAQQCFTSNAQLFLTTPATTIIDHKPTESAVSDDSILPGLYNLLTDSLHHSNALIRPTKECTLGKYQVDLFNRFWRVI